MEVTARSKSIRITPRKVRLVADSIRNQSVKSALQTLMLVEKRGAYQLKKTLQSAIANAVHNKKLKAEDLIIDRLEVNEGPFLKRFHASTRGRIKPYKRRSSHIMIVLRENKNENIKNKKVHKE